MQRDKESVAEKMREKQAAGTFLINPIVANKELTVFLSRCAQSS
jgi:hypothetical protein